MDHFTLSPAALEDESRYEHEQLVSAITGQLTRGAWGNAETAAVVMEAARLHDIGKNFIPGHILKKPSKLSGQEYEIVKKHTERGFLYLAGQIRTLLYAAIIALQHHERENGYEDFTPCHFGMPPVVFRARPKRPARFALWTLHRR